MTAVCHRITPPGTMPLTVLAMSPLCYSYFSRCYALLWKARLPTRLPPSRPLPPRRRRRHQGTVAPSFHVGDSRHSWRKNDFAANLHRDRIIVVRVGGREGSTDFPHLGRGRSECRSLLFEGWKEKSVKPHKCGEGAVAALIVLSRGAAETHLSRKRMGSLCLVWGTI